LSQIDRLSQITRSYGTAFLRNLVEICLKTVQTSKMFRKFMKFHQIKCSRFFRFNGFNLLLKNRNHLMTFRLSFRISTHLIRFRADSVIIKRNRRKNYFIKTAFNGKNKKISLTLFLKHHIFHILPLC
jgi:hypothetical protein